MIRKITFIFLIAFCAVNLNGQIHCPDHITMSCFMDTDTDNTGMAQVISANYHQSQVKFVDTENLSICNEGTIDRTFYIDANYNNTFDDWEPSCLQTITLEYERLPLQVVFPQDLTVTCIDDIPESSPTWNWNLCDIVGFSYDDETFEFADGACKKIVRHFTVINWCTYDGGNDGIYTGEQIIKIQDNDRPVLSACEDKEFGVDGTCQANVTLTNIASDIGDCPSNQLRWEVDIDLWADGTIDYVYGINEPVPFKLDFTMSGEEVLIEMPELLDPGKHKAFWRVTDGCGNFSTCETRFETKDLKPPTPYCLNFTGATINGEHDELVIKADFFDRGSFDNCSDQNVVFSFSENIEDQERILSCGDAGLQFFRIYTTDEKGNQDFCEVFMLVFDNNSCGGRYAPSGYVHDVHGHPIQNVNISMHNDGTSMALAESNEYGAFQFGEMPLYETAAFGVEHHNMELTTPGIIDLVVLQHHLLGLKPLNQSHLLAADLNSDGKVNFLDLELLRDIVTEKSSAEELLTWNFHPIHSNGEINFNATSIHYTNYQGQLDFIGFQKGLLSAPEELVDHIEIEVIQNGNEFVLISPQDVNIDGLVLYNGSKTSIQLTPNQNLKAKKAFAVINADHINQINGKLVLSGSKRLAQLSFKIVNKKVEFDYSKNIEQKDVSIYPTVFNEYLMIDAPGQHEVSLHKLDGSLISKTSFTDSKVLDNLAFLPNQIYLLRIDDQWHKVIKQ